MVLQLAQSLAVLDTNHNQTPPLGIFVTYREYDVTNLLDVPDVVGYCDSRAGGGLVPLPQHSPHRITATYIGIGDVPYGGKVVAAVTSWCAA